MKLPLTILFGVLLCSCSSSNRINLVLTGAGVIEKDAKVYNGSTEIGYVHQLKANKTGDTLFTIIKTNPDVKIPVGSTFTVYEILLGRNKIQVKYSNSGTSLTSKDVVYGKLISVQPSLPKADTMKGN
jgi:hypothetical protein